MNEKQINSPPAAQNGTAELSRASSKTLKSGKAKSIGPFEKLLMWHAGRLDGSRGLPAKQDGEWTSPLLNRLKDRNEEFCDHTWGKLQIAMEPMYVRLTELIDSIHYMELKLSLLKGNSPRKDETATTIRKRGEESLTESQVAARRNREKAKADAPRKAEIKHLEDNIRQAFEAFSNLCGTITERNNSTRIVCERVTYHTRQCMDVYWNSARGSHSKSQELPVIPDRELVPDRSHAEDTYMEQHHNLFLRAEELLEHINKSERNEGKEVA